MEAANLHTAASYVNNLLLARGLLRNGKPVEFSQLATFVPKEESRKNSGTAPIIVADVINLVHDLILKRDRDSDHHESLSSTLRNLRAEQAHSNTEIEHLKDRNTDLRRRLAASESTQRAAETSAKRAEATVRQLRDELIKTKKVVEQVRTQCANDIRKRDIQLSKLKSHLDQRTQQRGANKGPTGGMVVTVTSSKGSNGHVSGEKPEPLDVEDAQYSLRQETTTFLTQLSQELSNENDQLIALVRTTVATLKNLQGMPQNQLQRQSQHKSDSGLMSLDDSEELVHVNDVSYDTLSQDVEGVLSTLSDLLTNPNFAPLEEVHVRDEEIQRLRGGWERMEGRWHEAMTMMQSWRKRLMNGGDTVRIEELKKGLCLGEGLDSPRRVLIPSNQHPNQADDQEDAYEYEEIDDDAEEHEPTPDTDDLPAVEESLHASERPIFEAHESVASAKPLFDSTDETEQNQGAPALRETDPNNAPRPRSPSRPMSRLQPSDDENSSPLPAKPLSKAATSTSARVPVSKPIQPAKRHQPKSKLPARTVPSARSRATVPARGSPAPERDLSISEKLQIAERQARRTSSSPLNLNRSGSESPLELKASREVKEEQPEQQHVQSEVRTCDSQTSRVGSLRAVEAKTRASPVKRAKITGRPRRRKSTLSPDELEELMMGR